MNNPKTLTLWIVGVLAVAAVAWLGVSGFGRESQAAPAPVTVGADFEEDEEFADALTGDPFADEELDLEAGDALEGGEFGEDEGERAVVEVAPGTQGPTIRVLLEPANDRPVANAEVRWCEIDDGRARIGRGVSTSMLWLLAERFGPRLRTDAAGTVRLPVPKKRFVVTAQDDDGHFAWAIVDRRRAGRTVDLKLQVDLNLACVVTDATGQREKGFVPGTAVGLYRHDGRAWRLIKQDDADDAGRVEFRHLQRDLSDSRHFRRRNLDVMKRLAVALLVPLPEPVIFEFATDAMPEEAVELPLPGTGAIAVQIQGPTGKTYHNGGAVTLRVAGRTMPAGGFGGRFDDTRRARRGHAPAIEFRQVGLGMRFAPRVQLDDRAFTWDGAAFAGPVVADETLQHVIAMPAWIGTVAGRLVDDKGEPVAGERPSFLITSREGRFEGETVRTGPEGQFTVPFDVRRRQPVAPCWLDVRGRGSDHRGARVPLTGLRGGQRTDVGVMVFEPLPNLAWGRVTDDRGQPVRRARVRLQALRDRGDSANPDPVWREQGYVETRTAEDGTYELRGPTLPTRMRLQVSANSHVTITTQELAPGARIDHVLSRTATVTGELAAPAWFPGSAVRVTYKSVAEDGRQRRARIRLRNGRGTYQLRGIEPGVYDVTVTITGFEAPLERFDGLAIAPGQSDGTPLNLDGRVFRFALRALRPGGEVFVNLRNPLLAKVVGPDGKAAFAGFPWRRGKAEVISTSARLDVVLLGDGCRPIETTVGAGETDVMFEPVQPLHLTVAGARAACGVGRRVRVSAVYIGDTGLPNALSATDQRSGRVQGYARAQLSRSGGAWLGETDRVEMELMRDGRYRIVLRLYEEGVGRPVHRPVGTVDVRLSSEQPFAATVQVDPAVLRTAVDELAEQKARAQGSSNR